VGAYDAMTERVQSFIGQFGGKAYPSYEAMLEDPAVEVVVNLTTHTAHAAVTRQALMAGKHVQSEKPLATDRASGREVVELAKKKGLVLSCSPFVILGEAQQTLWKAVRDGMIGQVYAVNAEMFWGRIEAWHPNPVAFYSPGAGPMLDVAVYPLNILTSILGPVREVRAMAEITLKDRVILSGPQAGTKFEVTTPDAVFALLKFASGPMGRVTATFSHWRSNQGGMELHGTLGSLNLSTNVGFESKVTMSIYPDREWKEVPFIREPYKGVDWSRGALETVLAAQEGRPSRVSGAQAYHIVDICLSSLEAAQSGQTVKVNSTFDPPKPLD
jgi:predicted dehydrogenase